ncbi:MAG: DUF3343 domain-containing protein [Firmicutes bacterium]|nr:DUF3343 domain-containing protein [Bacillota bacterium]
MNTMAVFNSRSDALRLKSGMDKLKIATAIINTPRNQNLSCGLSVVLDEHYKSKAEHIVIALGLTSFRGFFDKN